MTVEHHPQTFEDGVRLAEEMMDGKKPDAEYADKKGQDEKTGKDRKVEPGLYRRSLSRPLLLTGFLSTMASLTFEDKAKAQAQERMDEALEDPKVVEKEGCHRQRGTGVFHHVREAIAGGE